MIDDKVVIDCGCTPRSKLTIDLDPNPNGLPVLWIRAIVNRTDLFIPLDKQAVSKLIVELQRRVGEM